MIIEIEGNRAHNLSGKYCEQSEELLSNKKRYSAVQEIDDGLRCIHINENSHFLLKGNYIINSVSSIDKFLKSIESLKESISWPDSKPRNYFYRGQLIKWQITSSLFRNESWAKNETTMTSTIFENKPEEFIDCKTLFEKLVKLKHFDFPTRLLDLTKNPLIALYFAIYCMEIEKEPTIGSVHVCFSIAEKEKHSYSSDWVNILSSIAMGSEECKRCKHYCDSKPDFNNFLESCDKWYNAGEPLSEHEIDEVREFRECRFNKECIYNVVQENPAFEPKDGQPLTSYDKVILVHPTMNNGRIIQQQGVFLLLGKNHNDPYQENNDLLMKFFKAPSIFPNQESMKEYIFVIKPENKEKLKNQLASLGIDEYYLFPDFERCIKQVKNHYIMTNEDK